MDLFSEPTTFKCVEVDCIHFLSKKMEKPFLYHTHIQTPLDLHEGSENYIVAMFVVILICVGSPKKGFGQMNSYTHSLLDA